MKTQFYIARHGQTLFNVKHLYQGWCDSPLLEKGIQQAKALHNGLANIPFEVAVSSTSERAIDTMNYALEGRDVPKKWDKGLKEVYFGEYEGDPGSIHHVSEDQNWIGYAFCGGEDRDQAYERFKKTLENYAVGGNVLIVTHGAVISRMVQHLDPEEWKLRKYPDQLVPNCSVTRIDYEDGEFTLIHHPDTSYLED